jgi:hypothetical protein
MYDDGLVLFGTVKNNEVEEFNKVMIVFGQMSGLQINNSKSVVWFSSRVTNRMRKDVLDKFPAKEPDDSTTYLEYPVPKGKVKFTADITKEWKTR